MAGQMHKYSYDKHNLPTPDGLKGPQTCKMAVTYADMAETDPQTICEAACWANTYTFAKLYFLMPLPTLMQSLAGEF